MSTNGMMEENKSGMAQLREYPVRPGEKVCQFYVKTGRCGYGESCCYNHPQEIAPEKINLPKCKYFLRGFCMFGSSCVYNHSKEGDGAEPMRQGRKRNITESSPSPCPSPEKRAKIIEKQRIEAKDNLQEESLREKQENDNDQVNLEEQRKKDIERQRREARLRLDQIKQTVFFDDATRIRKILTEFGIILTEGDGY